MVHLAAAGDKLEFKKLSKYFPQALDENTDESGERVWRTFW